MTGTGNECVHAKGNVSILIEETTQWVEEQADKKKHKQQIINTHNESTSQSNPQPPLWQYQLLATWWQYGDKNVFVRCKVEVTLKNASEGRSRLAHVTFWGNSAAVSRTRKSSFTLMVMSPVSCWRFQTPRLFQVTSQISLLWTLCHFGCLNEKEKMIKYRLNCNYLL